MYKKMKTVIRSRKDGLEISVLAFLPGEEERESCRGVVQLVHGMSEYKERYIPFMEYLAGEGFASIIHDHRGHGKSVRSQEDLGYMYGGGAEALLDDMLQVNQLAEKTLPGIPLIMLGHSMGSLAARAFTRKYDDRIDALILSGSPSNNPGRLAGTLLAQMEKKFLGDRHVSKAIEKLSFGTYNRKFKEEEDAFSWVCSSPEVVAAYEASPLCGFTFTADGYLVVFELMKQAYSEKGWKCSKPDLPVLFVGGADDPCIGGPGRFADALNHMRIAGYYNVRGKLYPGMRHEILNETENRKVFHDIEAFLRKKGF